MATRAPSHAEEERAIFEAFLAAHPSLAAEVESIHQPDDEFPDVILELKDGTDVDFELGEWLDGAQMAEAKRHERLLQVRIEVYSPIDLMGFQLLLEHLPPLFKYLDVGRGFVVEISIDPVDDSVDSVWYPYTFPAGQDMLAWLEGVGRKARAFLGQCAVLPGDRLQLPGPGGTTTLLVEVREVFDDPDVREVIFTAGSRSTDARLLFECGTSEDTARSGWGRKLKDKMRQRQAGLPAPSLLRMLVVNFAQADTGWPEFFGWPGIAKRLEATVRLIAGELTASLPYDVVLPARLDLECCFGQPVWLNSSLEAQGAAFIKAAGLEHLCSGPPAQGQDANLDELLELGPRRR